MRDAIIFLRETGAKVIAQREKDMAKGLPVPTDVLSFVIDTKSMCFILLSIFANKNVFMKFNIVYFCTPSTLCYENIINK